MQHQIVRLLPKTDFDFSALPIGGSVTSLPLLQNIDISNWSRGTMLVRVHANTSISTSSFRLDLRAVAPTDEDPGAFFRANLVSTVSVVAGQVTPPVLIRNRLAPNSGAAVSLFLSVTAAANIGTIAFTISVDLLLADHAPDWSPSDLGSRLTLWLDERDLVDVSGHYSDWGDQSSAMTNDFQQLSSGLRPADTAGINAFPAPAFDGASTFLKSSTALSSFVRPNSYHVFVVLRVLGISGTDFTAYLNDGVIADQGLGWWGLYLKNNAGANEVHGFHYTATLYEAVALGLKLGEDTLVEWSYDGTTIRCQVGSNVAAIGAGGGNIGDLTNGIGIGFGATGGKILKGAIASIIVCNAYLSPGESSSVRDYLSSKYGVAK